jgi:hypothetical protein
MPRLGRSAVAVTAVVALLSACGSSPPEDTARDPATVKVSRSGLARVTLSKQGAERIGVRTAPVRRAGGGRLEIPYAAILYAPDGRAYAFTEPHRLTFDRRPITVASIRGNEAILSDGPSAGAKVVRVGASELYGAETGVEGE